MRGESCQAARVKLFQFHSVIGLDCRDHNDKLVTFSGRNSFAYISVKLYHTHTHTRTAVALVCSDTNEVSGGAAAGAPPELDQFAAVICQHLTTVATLVSQKSGQLLDLFEVPQARVTNVFPAKKQMKLIHAQ